MDDPKMVPVWTTWTPEENLCFCVRVLEGEPGPGPQEITEVVYRMKAAVRQLLVDKLNRVVDRKLKEAADGEKG